MEKEKIHHGGSWVLANRGRFSIVHFWGTDRKKDLTEADSGLKSGLKRGKKLKWQIDPSMHREELRKNTNQFL